RSADFVVNASSEGSSAGAARIVVPSSTATASVAGNVTRNTVWWPWLGLLAALAIAAEWLIAMSRVER
ncbi:MAG: hypothetical protein JWO42_186, partial [Chloroflexi bacterium]|nr:hypothetical protein [Chloroflexota bacterium]